MAAFLAQAHTQRIEALRRVRHTLQGEEPTIVLKKRDATTNALVDLLSIDRGWTYGDRDVTGGRLPPQVMYELWVAEDLITRANVAQGAVWQHGQAVFQIAWVSQGEPGIFQPTGIYRFWRFWLAPLEEV